MKVSDFAYALPPGLIAKRPKAQRSASRLMTVDCGSGAVGHQHFRDLPELLHPGDLLVFNDTRVIPARLYGHKASGGRVEVLLERVLPGRGEGKQEEGQGAQGERVLAQLRANKKPRLGSQLLFAMPALVAPQAPTAGQAFVANKAMEGSAKDIAATQVAVKVVARQGEFFLLEFPPQPGLARLLQAIGHTPLPPYIDRADSAEDAVRYQTVYGSKDGAVAAPTAGLHFDEALLDVLAQRGVEKAFVTLHVGAGTFQPLRVAQVEQHQMHKEWMEVNGKVCQQIARCRARDGRVVAVGTTAVRVLETAAMAAASNGSDSKASRADAEQGLAPYRGDTNIFIYPGFRFQAVDAMITNFHMPESTLLMLVSAFAGTELVRQAYQEAIVKKYRFFSYGDAMLLHR